MAKTLTQPKTLAAKIHPFHTNAQTEALELYGTAVQEMQMGNFSEALDGFSRIDGAAPPEVRERARVHRQACERQLEERERRLEFHSAIEQYDYAMVCIGNNDYEEARDHLTAIVEQDDAADYAHYGLATLHGMTGHAEGCLHHLQRAIELRPFNRITARSDGDFRQMADDPRFTELLYPEAI